MNSQRKTALSLLIYLSLTISLLCEGFPYIVHGPLQFKAELNCTNRDCNQNSNWSNSVKSPNGDKHLVKEHENEKLLLPSAQVQQNESSLSVSVVHNKSKFTTQNNAFTIQYSSFTTQNNSFTTQNNSSTTQNNSFTTQNNSFTIQNNSFTTHATLINEKSVPENGSKETGHRNLTKSVEDSELHGQPQTSSFGEFAKWEEVYDEPSEEEAKRIRRFDPSRLNYTGLRIAIDDWLEKSFPSRSPRLLRDASLPGFLTNLGQMMDFDQLVTEIETSIMSSVSCNACRGGMGLLQHYINTGRTRDEIILAASRLCSSFNVETPRVCYGIINLMADEVLYVAKNVIMTPDEVCGFVIGDICGSPYNPLHDWKVTFPPVPKPPIRNWVPHRSRTRNLKVLHLSDTHFDPEYLEGSNAECDEPICCRSTSGPPENPEKAAGYWGDYRKCDTPKRTIYNMFENILYFHSDIDYILWTGDLPPHDVWNQTKESNVHILRETVNQLLTFFPKTPIFPALGNHESAPVNSFPPAYVPEEFGVDWLYRELYNQWSRWLPKETAPTILKGGFYSVLVRPGFRIISVNTNFCNNKNWWLLVNSTDPAQELQWLIFELQGAEFRGERVHIIGHIPPGHNDCLKVWSKNYYSIINRYESTISAQFFGHTHYDEFEIFYDELRPRRAINVAYIGPSVTSYYGLNPGYRLYSIEGEYEGSSKAVIDHETWIMDMQKANEEGTMAPRWYKLYSALHAYGLRSLRPQEWDILVDRMTEEDELFEMYYRFYWKDSPVKDTCNRECKKRLLCDLKSARSHDRKVTCADVNEQVEAQERMGWGGWLFSGITVTSLATWWLWG